MIHSGSSPFPGLGLEDGHVPRSPNYPKSLPKGGYFGYSGGPGGCHDKAVHALVGVCHVFLPCETPGIQARALEL